MKRISLLAAAILAMLTTGAWADTCFVGTSPINFGVYDTLATSPLDTTGQLDIDCRPPHWAAHSHPVIYKRISLDAGLHSSGSFFPRQQLSATDGTTMAYNLYLDAARTQVWGDGSGSTYVLEHQVDGTIDPHHHDLPEQADCHAHAVGSEEDHELGECHAHISPKFVRKFHLRVQGERHEHPTGEYKHHDFVSTVLIYARIPAQQTDLTPGTFSDTITVTISF